MNKTSMYLLITYTILLAPHYSFSMESIEELIMTQDTPNRLLIRAAQENDVPQARAALALGANINANVWKSQLHNRYNSVQFEGVNVSALGIAIDKDFLPFVAFLLKQGCWVDFLIDKEPIITWNGHTNPPKPCILGSSKNFLTHCVDEVKWDMARLLFLFGSEAKESIIAPKIYPEPLLLAIATRDYQKYHDILGSEACNPRSIQTALALAAGRCDSFFVRDLLEKNTIPIAAFEEALALAAKSRDSFLVRNLLEKNAIPIAAFDVATGILRRSNLQQAKRNLYQEIHGLLELPALRACLMALKNERILAGKHTSLVGLLPQEIIRELLAFYSWRPRNT